MARSNFVGDIYGWEWQVIGTEKINFGHRYYVLRNIRTGVKIYINDNTMTRLSNGVTTIESVIKWQRDRRKLCTITKIKKK